MVIEKKDTLLKDEAKVTRVDKDIQMRKEVGVCFHIEFSVG